MKCGTPYPSENIRDNHYLFAEQLGEIHLTESVFLPEKLSEHTHDFAELVCITGGCGVHMIDGHPNRTRRGDVFLIDPGVRHTYEALTPGFTWINCIFRPQHLCDVFNTNESALQLLAYMMYHNIPADPDALCLTVNLREEGEDLSPIFENMLQEYQNKKSGYEEILEYYLKILLTKIARHIHQVETQYENYSKKNRIIEEVVGELNRMSPENLNAKQFADRYFLSQAAFSRQFKKHTGCSFLEYVTRLRIQDACELLLTTNATIYDIQCRVGYQDPKSFYRSFRRITGMTPSEYKSNHLMQEEKNEDDSL